ncbi:hypothetical protein POM88_031696 [Heracleum sosnowskyi]|uniref:Uncharacterized protein n=1 Tax=Heracleum sosnowskyi TaxID=360622 RepID=A0AAD8HYQ8_9APIA|nr:hypothetical protein POM88_031696 [Heracleum sosnowskyi]
MHLLKKNSLKNIRRKNQITKPSRSYPPYYIKLLLHLHLCGSPILMISPGSKAIGSSSISNFQRKSAQDTTERNTEEKDERNKKRREVYQKVFKQQVLTRVYQKPVRV